MSAFANTLLYFAVALLAAETARIKTQQSANKSMGADHKCTISWPARGNSAPVTTSFGVKSCLINCKITNEASRPENRYLLGLKAIQMTKTCSCQTLEGRELFKSTGTCSPRACWDTYAIMMTDHYASEFNRETLKVFHNHKLGWDNTFDYTTCQNNGCRGGTCTEYSFPSLWDSRDSAEKKLLAELVKQVAIKGGKGLSGQQKDLVRTLAKGDIEQAAELAKEDATSDVAEQIQQLFLRAQNDEDIVETPKVTPKADPIAVIYTELVDSLGSDGGLTVRKLKQHYKVLVANIGISVDHMATVAGLTDDDHIVSLAGLTAFLKPAC